MRWIVNVIKALALLLVILIAVSFLLPAQRMVERSRQIAAPPERIWPLIADPRRWNGWSPWLAKDPATKLSYAGAASGAGAEWAWESATQGQGHMRFDSAQAPRHLAYTLVFDDMGLSNTGEFRLEPVPGGTRVVWNIESRFGFNPLMRWFGLALDRMVGPDFETGLARLETAALAR
jgi:uncharacterized protein YndB with AHSA1/START domain